MNSRILQLLEQARSIPIAQENPNFNFPPKFNSINLTYTQTMEFKQLLLKEIEETGSIISIKEFLIELSTINRLLLSDINSKEDLVNGCLINFTSNKSAIIMNNIYSDFMDIPTKGEVYEDITHPYGWSDVFTFFQDSIASFKIILNEAREAARAAPTPQEVWDSLSVPNLEAYNSQYTELMEEHTANLILQDNLLNISRQLDSCLLKLESITVLNNPGINWSIIKANILDPTACIPIDSPHMYNTGIEVLRAFNTTTLF